MPLPNMKPKRKKRGPVFPFMLLMATACVLYQATRDAQDEDYESEGETKRHKAVPVFFVEGGKNKEDHGLCWESGLWWAAV